MSSDKKRLGRGISSLLGSDFDFDDHVEEIISKTAAEKPAETKPEKKKVSIPEPEREDTGALKVLEVSIDSVSPNPNQPRKTFDEAALNELAASIKEQGIIQPIVVEEIVHGKYSIVAGERRFRAAKIAGLDKVPVIIKKLTEQQRIQMSLVENIYQFCLKYQKENPMTLKEMLDSQSQIAKSEGTASRRS